MHQLPGYSNDFVLPYENLLKVVHYVDERFYRQIILWRIQVKINFCLLKNHHGIKVSLRMLHRFLRWANFYRKVKQSPLLDIVIFIQYELEGCGSCISYRAMHQRCIRNGLMVSQVIVTQIMKHLDPIGASTGRRGTLRRRLYYTTGPNWVWHSDGYSKLKPYGFEIHG